MLYCISPVLTLLPSSLWPVIIGLPSGLPMPRLSGSRWRKSPPCPGSPLSLARSRLISSLLLSLACPKERLAAPMVGPTTNLKLWTLGRPLACVISSWPDSRPIVVPPSLYRLWAKAVAKSFINNILGFLPNDWWETCRGPLRCGWLSVFLQFLNEEGLTLGDHSLVFSFDLTKSL